MALADGIKGATQFPQSITWTDEDSFPVNLTGAAITGYFRKKGATSSTAITGSLDVFDAVNGVFTWDYHADDVAAGGHYDIQFIATYGSGEKEKTIITDWIVKDSLD